MNRSRALVFVLLSVWCCVFAVNTSAHPLGNFTINHFSHLEVGVSQIKVHYVIDMAEIPTLQELQLIDTNRDGKTSEDELHAYSSVLAARYADGLVLTIGSRRLPVQVQESKVSLRAGSADLNTLRIEVDLSTPIQANGSPQRLLFEDTNHSDRIGWREIVVSPTSGVTIFDSSAYGNAVTDELKSYPSETRAPLDERSAEFKFVAGSAPIGGRTLLTRNGKPTAMPTRDRFAELITVPQLTLGVVLFGLLVAMTLGAFHALSPGHGKTVVGAYLIGSRGTVRHAAFLGLTVTITHTAGVFALGFLTLLASEYVLPERLFPILSFASGAIVVVIGVSLLIKRSRSVLGLTSHSHSDDHTHESDVDPTQPHSHGGRTHSHLPPGANGSPITWRSLLALGISGGLLPCPSALVVLLSAISLNRVGYGLLLVVAFSAGLAGTLTAVGLAFVYAGRLFKSTGRFSRALTVLPVFSALVISLAGLAICYGALSQAAPSFAQIWFTASAPSFVSASALGVLSLGFVYGLKHATEADHIVAVSTIVSEHRKLTRAALVGGLWGIGHTASLVVVGAIVLALRIAIPERVANWLEFGVAIMIVFLGVMAFRRALRNRYDFHVHRHAHDSLAHSHVHFHEPAAVHEHSHQTLRLGFKPAIVGAVHGLAGSAALTLLVLTQISSPLLGFLYLAVFGLGSIFGMLVMSGLVGLPFALGSQRLEGFHHRLQFVASVFSVVFGLWYGYEAGVASGLMAFDAAAAARLF